jgi:hypothetical protein
MDPLDAANERWLTFGQSASAALVAGCRHPGFAFVFESLALTLECDEDRGRVLVTIFVQREDRREVYEERH